MPSAERECFSFSIKPMGQEWSWAAIDDCGRVRAQGSAPTKAIAAAFVIRTIARSAERRMRG